MLISDFEIVSRLDNGHYGKTFLVQKKDTNDVFVMKLINKDKVGNLSSAMSDLLKNDVLTKSDHPFLVDLKYSF